MIITKQCITWTGNLIRFQYLDSHKFTTKFFVYNGYYIKDVKEVWRTEKSQS